MPTTHDAPKRPARKPVVKPRTPCQILALGQWTASATSLPTLMGTTTRRLRGQLHADLCRVMTTAADPATLVVGAEATHPARGAAGTRRPGTPIPMARIPWPDLRGGPLVIDTPSHAPPVFGATMRRLGMKHAVIAALPSADSPSGLIELYWSTPQTSGTDTACLVQFAAVVLGLALARNRAEQARAATEKQYRTIIEQSTEGAALIAQDGTFLYNSPAAKQIYGYSPAELQGRNAFDFTHPDEISGLRKKISAFWKRPGGTLELLHRWRHKDGTWRWIESSSRNLIAEPGVNAIVANYRDVTAKKQAEAALRRSEETWRALVSNAPEYILILTPTGVMTFANRAVPTLTVDYLLGKNLQDFVAPADRRPLRQLFDRVRRTGKASILDVRTGGPVMPPGWFRVHAGPLRRNGKTEALVVIGTDITLERQLLDQTTESRRRLHVQSLELSRTVKRLRRHIEREQTIQHSLRDSRARLRALSARLLSIQETERTNLSREIHDELGQTLTAIKMEIEQMRRNCPTIIPLCQQSIERASHLIDSTIDIVRQIAKGLRPGALDDLGLVPAVEGFVQDFQQRTGIQCTLHLPSNEPIIGSQAATTAFRVLQEALTNVARHARATRVTVRLAATDRRLTLGIRDNGIGFHHRDAMDEESLGLIGIRERVRLCDGTVTFKGGPGHGTLVQIDLPLATAAPKRSTPRARSRQRHV